MSLSKAYIDNVLLVKARFYNVTEAARGCDYHVICSACAMDYKYIAVRIPACDNADMRIIAVERQITLGCRFP